MHGFEANLPKFCKYYISENSQNEESYLNWNQADQVSPPLSSASQVMG